MKKLLTAHNIRFAVKAAAAVFLFLIGKWLAHLILDERVENVAYAGLRAINHSSPAPSDYPVRIVDISGVRDYISKSQPTPSKVLEGVVEALCKLNPPPKSIGIDIDFATRGPGEAGGPRQPGPVATLYADHLRFLRYVANKADEPSSPKIYVGVGYIPGDLSKVFIPDHSDPAMARLAGRLSKVAANVVTEADPSSMPSYYLDRSKTPFYSLGRLLSDAIDPVENRSLTLWQQTLSRLSPHEATGLPWGEHSIDVDYGIARAFGDITVEATIESKPDSGISATLSPTTFAKLQSSLGRFGKEGPGYAVLVGYARTESGGDAMVLQSSGPTFIAVGGEIYPRVLQHAAYVDTYLENPFVKASEAMATGLEVLLAILFFWLNFAHETAIERLVAGNSKVGFRLILTALLFTIGLALLWSGLLGAFHVHLSVLWFVVLVAVLTASAGLPMLLACRQSEERALRSQVARHSLVRVALATIAIGLTLLLAKVGVFWTGSLVVVLFVMLEGYLEPVLVYLGLACINRFRKEPILD